MNSHLRNYSPITFRSFLQDNVIKQYQAHILTILRTVYVLVSRLIHEVNNTELVAWKRNQQLAGNGFKLSGFKGTGNDNNFDTQHLDMIQSW